MGRRVILGWLIANFLRIYPPARRKLEMIIGEILRGAEASPRRKIFVMLVGYSLSGKSWFIRHHSQLSRFFQVDTRKIHDLLNQSFRILQDGKTTSGSGYWPRQFLTRTVRESVFEKAGRIGMATVSDSANLVREERQKRLQAFRRWGYETAIVHVACPKERLMERLEALDAQRQARGEAPTWVRLYEDVQKNRFNPPQRGEADHIYLFVSAEGGEANPNWIRI